jgi:arginine-tRNA-protein transferase
LHTKDKHTLAFDLTETFPCGYLPQRQERLMVLVPSQTSFQHYNHLIQFGFRRSGEQIYRPHCTLCQACESLRIPVAEFLLSRSQKRIVLKNNDLEIVYSQNIKADYYPLYERYINTRHAEGSMYPANHAQFESFLTRNQDTGFYIEFR